MAVATAVILVGVVVVAVGRGGEMAYFSSDYAPLDLGVVAATDVVLLRPPTSIWGYNIQVTDEALDRITEALSQRDIRIASLEQRVADLRAERDLHLERDRRLEGDRRREREWDLRDEQVLHSEPDPRPGADLAAVDKTAPSADTTGAFPDARAARWEARAVGWAAAAAGRPPVGLNRRDAVTPDRRNRAAGAADAATAPSGETAAPVADHEPAGPTRDAGAPPPGAPPPGAPPPDGHETAPAASVAAPTANQESAGQDGSEAVPTAANGSAARRDSAAPRGDSAADSTENVPEPSSVNGPATGAADPGSEAAGAENASGRPDSGRGAEAGTGEGGHGENAGGPPDGGHPESGPDKDGTAAGD